METTLKLKQILQRYSLDHNLLHSYHELKDLNINQEFIYTLLRAFENEKDFAAEDFQAFSLPLVVDYIRRTHRYYLDKKLPEIEQSIEILLKDYDGNHPLLFILNRFYADYKSHLAAHIKAEETYLLPHIDYLINVEKGEVPLEEFRIHTKTNSLKNFIESHQNTEEDISEVRNAMLTYEPPITNQTPYRILVTQLQMFEADLGIHALVEDKVLVPRAQELENALYNRLS